MKPSAQQQEKMEADEVGGWRKQGRVLSLRPERLISTAREGAKELLTVISYCPFVWNWSCRCRSRTVSLSKGRSWQVCSFASSFRTTFDRSDVASSLRFSTACPRLSGQRRKRAKLCSCGHAEASRTFRYHCKRWQQPQLTTTHGQLF